MTSAVERMYDVNPAGEWGRLERHPVEYATTRRALKEFLPENSSILDIGGGPGRYSIDLALDGHRVTLLDLSQANLDFAKAKAEDVEADIKQFIKGNALYLTDISDNSFDSVLIMGPLYHLLEVEERAKAVSEAMRVLRPGGVLFASFITRYAFIIDMLAKCPANVPNFKENISYGRLLETGLHLSTEFSGFTDAYFIHPFEVEPFMGEFGLDKLRLAGAEGIMGANEGAILGLEAGALQRWFDVCYELGTDPCTWGMACHMLYVGRKAREDN